VGAVHMAMRTIGQIISISAVAASLLTACGGSGDSTSPPIVVQGVGVERIDAAMNAVMSRHAPPGIAVAVARNGALVFANAYGSADIAGTEPLRPDHLFRIASVSKPVTGIAALRAVDEGLLDPDAAAFEVLSSYLPQSGADPRIAQITVRNLMHHTSGWNIWDYPDDPLFRSKEISSTLGVPMPITPQDLTRWVATQPLAFDPGTAFAYTNIGFVVLGRVIEQSTGYAYEDFVHRFVMEPAGITQAQLGGITRAERRPNEVEYESFQNSIWTSVFDGVSSVSEPAYGGINLVGFDASSAWLMSAVDLVKLVAAADGDSAYPDVISQESFELMKTVGTPTGVMPLIGVAWYLGTDGSGNIVKWDHAGGMPGSTAYVTRLPSGVIFAVVSNTSRDAPFFDDLAVGMTNAVEGITVWPNTDLFPQFP
jgi:CubicO group peptidase (beta-lactamase class C family)